MLNEYFNVFSKIQRVYPVDRVEPVVAVFFFFLILKGTGEKGQRHSTGRKTLTGFYS